MVSTSTLLETLAEDCGYSSVTNLLEASSYDSLVPAICITEGCGYTSEYEPDSQFGWCECCEKGTMKSALILAGII